MKRLQTKAFTLVELIVVITILAVLATVWFISMTGYSRDSRDSVRLTDLKSITKAFEIQKTKDIKLALPDKKVDISASGSVFQYQGLLSENILWTASVHGGWTDPQTGEYYGYVVNRAQNKFQVIWFLENWENIVNNHFNISQSYTDNSNKFPKVFWDILWFFTTPLESKIITQSWTLSQIDVLLTQQEYTYVQPNNLVAKETTGTGYTLASQFTDILYPRADCNALLQNWFATTSGLYNISPDNINTYQVYCDMETDWGGWTLFNGSSAKIGWENYVYNDSSPNFDNYNMSGAILEKILVNKWNKTIKHVMKRNDESIVTDITLNINPQLISLDIDETYLCFTDKKNDLESTNIDYLDKTILPVSHAIMNDNKELYSQKVNDILRVRLYCPNYNIDWDNYYSHLKVYKNGQAHHLPWDSFLSDNTAQQYSQYYIQDDYLDVDASQLPTFWWSLQWMKLNGEWSQNFLNGLNALPEDANKAVLSAPEVPNGLWFEVYMMIK